MDQSIRGSHFSEFIFELTSIEISKVRFGVHGEEYDYDIIRAPRYTQYREDVDAYEIYMARLSNQTIAEACFFTNDQATTVLKFLHKIYLSYVDSNRLVEAHQSLFEKNKFNSALFEQEFFTIFNIPRRITFSDGHPDFGDLRTTKHFWSDLRDALMYKYGALRLVFSTVKGLFNITLPEHNFDFSPVSVGSPDASEIRFHIQENKIEPLFLVLRDFFDTNDQEFLLRLLRGEKIERQLQFKGSAIKIIGSLTIFVISFRNS